MIEAANPFLNLRKYVDFLRLGDKAKSAALYATYAVWLPVRVGLPVYLMQGMIRKSIPEFGTDPWCVVPTYFTGSAITVFCVAVWLFHLTPDLLADVRGDGKRREAKEPKLYSATATTSPPSQLAAIHGNQQQAESNKGGSGTGAVVLELCPAPVSLV